MRTYGTVVEAILCADRLRPAGRGRGTPGPGAARFRSAEDGGPSCSVGPAEPGGGVGGQGWGETGREAFLAALADALEPGG